MNIEYIKKLVFFELTAYSMVIMERKAIYTQDLLAIRSFQNINDAFEYNRETIESAVLGVNESLSSNIYPEIDVDGHELWYVTFSIIQYYNPNTLIDIIEDKKFT